ncbi:NAD(P)H-binding protein [Modestobacter sp. I12A-02628]|uniref:NmrA family NAD(P)-binding protein n=1 Tax=Goekera deserti TaxID=2497753 RepID=A0A7K3WM65_9ACTN|nr:NmrA family NAD(P)-binding protein [Goekera deserti]MPQ99994.1 NAD(P)H-binding protein [Goekera deserti]NDI49773.1 NmrA family NAD(P)-binding protein [Goekera deserti]NEL56623.1 NmrA family NAD(P)-binding protein [Goekera deserti]
MIVVTAAAGKTGTAVVRALRARGEDVRAVVAGRRPRPELTALGAEVVHTDLSVPAGWETVLDGADAFHLIWPNFDAEEQDGAPALFAQARRAGVPRVVYHSVLRPQLRAMPHHAAKDAVEEALDGSGVRWRVLQPCAYADNLDDQLPEVERTGELRSHWGLLTGQSLVDLRDVADAAVALLTEDGLDGGTFEAVGPQALTAEQIADEMGRQLGREVTAVDVVPQGPVPQGYVSRCARTMYDHYRYHGFTGSPRVLTDLLGRPPRTYAEHLADVLGARAVQVLPDEPDDPVERTLTRLRDARAAGRG